MPEVVSEAQKPWYSGFAGKKFAERGLSTMNEINEYGLQKLERLEHRKRLREASEKKRRKKFHDALVFKTGEIMLDCWPCVKKLRIHHTREENEIELAPLRDLLLKIAADPYYSTAINAIAIDQDRPEKPDSFSQTLSEGRLNHGKLSFPH